MSIICQNFVQNTWRKDLCCNCFKSELDHRLFGGKLRRESTFSAGDTDVLPKRSLNATVPSEGTGSRYMSHSASVYYSYWKSKLPNPERGGAKSGCQGSVICSTKNVRMSEGALSSPEPSCSVYNIAGKGAGAAGEKSTPGLNGVEAIPNGGHKHEAPKDADGPKVNGTAAVNGKTDHHGVPINGVRKSSVTAKRRNSVGFIDTLPEVIGYGGCDYGDEDDHSDENPSYEPSDVDSLEGYELTEEDRQFMQLTVQNTEFNADTTNLLTCGVKSPKLSEKQKLERGGPKRRHTTVNIFNGNTNGKVKNHVYASTNGYSREEDGAECNKSSGINGKTHLDPKIWKRFRKTESKNLIRMSYNLNPSNKSTKRQQNGHTEVNGDAEENLYENIHDTEIQEICDGDDLEDVKYITEDNHQPCIIPKKCGKVIQEINGKLDHPDEVVEAAFLEQGEASTITDDSSDCEFSVNGKDWRSDGDDSSACQNLNGEPDPDALKVNNPKIKTTDETRTPTPLALFNFTPGLALNAKKPANSSESNKKTKQKSPNGTVNGKTDAALLSCHYASSPVNGSTADRETNILPKKSVPGSVTPYSSTAILKVATELPGEVKTNTALSEVPVGKPPVTKPKPKIPAKPSFATQSCTILPPPNFSDSHNHSEPVSKVGSPFTNGFQDTNLPSTPELSSESPNSDSKIGDSGVGGLESESEEDNDYYQTVMEAEEDLIDSDGKEPGTEYKEAQEIKTMEQEEESNMNFESKVNTIANALDFSKQRGAKRPAPKPPGAFPSPLPGRYEGDYSGDLSVTDSPNCPSPSQLSPTRVAVLPREPPPNRYVDTDGGESPVPVPDRTRSAARVQQLTRSMTQYISSSSSVDKLSTHTYSNKPFNKSASLTSFPLQHSNSTSALASISQNSSPASPVLSVNGTSTITKTKHKRGFSIRKLLKFGKDDSLGDPKVITGNGFTRRKTKLEILHPLDLMNNTITKNGSAADLSPAGESPTVTTGVRDGAMTPSSETGTDSYETIKSASDTDLVTTETQATYETTVTSRRGDCNLPTVSQVASSSYSSFSSSSSSKSSSSSANHQKRFHERLESSHPVNGVYNKPPPPPRAKMVSPTPTMSSSAHSDTNSIASSSSGSSKSVPAKAAPARPPPPNKAIRKWPPPKMMHRTMSNSCDMNKNVQPQVSNNDELKRWSSCSGATAASNSDSSNVYANLGDIRNSLVPKKPERTSPTSDGPCGANEESETYENESQVYENRHTRANSQDNTEISREENYANPVDNTDQAVSVSHSVHNKIYHSSDVVCTEETDGQDCLYENIGAGHDTSQKQEATNEPDTREVPRVTSPPRVENSSVEEKEPAPKPSETNARSLQREVAKKNALRPRRASLESCPEFSPPQDSSNISRETQQAEKDNAEHYVSSYTTKLSNSVSQDSCRPADNLGHQSGTPIVAPSLCGKVKLYVKRSDSGDSGSSTASSYGTGTIVTIDGRGGTVIDVADVCRAPPPVPSSTPPSMAPPPLPHMMATSVLSDDGESICSNMSGLYHYATPVNAVGGTAWSRRKTSRLSVRKGKTVVHKNLEDNYGAVVSANHQALAQLLEQNSVSKQNVNSRLKMLDDLPLQWADFMLPEDLQLTVVGNKVFCPALWQNSHEVTLMVSPNTLHHSTPAHTSPYSLHPIAEFEDVLPQAWISSAVGEQTCSDSADPGDKEGLPVTVWVLDRINVMTITQHTDTLLTLLKQNDCDIFEREAAFVLLQFICGLKHLQAVGIEEVDPFLLDFVLLTDSKDTNPRLAIISEASVLGVESTLSTSRGVNASSTYRGSWADSKSDEKLSLCQCALATMLQFLQVEDAVSAARELCLSGGDLDDAIPHVIPCALRETFLAVGHTLQQERANSLSQAKLALEFVLYGPTDLSADFRASVIDQEQAYQRWLDLERATVLNNLIRTQSLWQLQLSVYDEFQMTFLVRSCAKTLREAAVMLQDRK